MNEASKTPTAPPRSARQQALGRELPDEPQAIGPRRQPNRNLLLPSRGAAEQQVRHVGRDDEQNAEAHREAADGASGP